MAADRGAFDLTLTDGTVRRAVRVDDPAALDAAMASLGVLRPSPVIVLIGGAGKLADADATAAAATVEQAVVPVATERDAAIVDGGTDAGIMRYAGQARTKLRSPVPLVGVAAVGTVSFPGNEGTREDPAPLQSDHSHFVLVPGTEWGAESPWLPRVASAIAEKQKPIVTVLINGGAVSANDVRESLKAGSPVVIVRGTGRLADQLAQPDAAHGELSDIVRSSQVHVTESARPDAVRKILLGILQPGA